MLLDRKRPAVLNRILGRPTTLLLFVYFHIRPLFFFFLLTSNKNFKISQFKHYFFSPTIKP